jgi:hypothetical protein
MYAKCRGPRQIVSNAGTSVIRSIDSVRVGSRVHSAVNGKIGPWNVRGAPDRRQTPPSRRSSQRAHSCRAPSRPSGQSPEAGLKSVSIGPGCPGSGFLSRCQGRLDQGPFGISQDDGCFTIVVTQPSRDHIRNFVTRLVGYTREEDARR